MVFNEKLMELRRQKRLSQEQLGNEVGVSRQTVSKWELGTTTPELDKLIQLSDFFEITIDELVGREPAPSADTASTADALEEDDNYSFHSSSIHPSPFRNRHGEYVPFNATYYEYKSKRTLFGLPLVHINVSQHGFHHMRRAKGILAIGDIAHGFLAIGGAAYGLIALGGLACGLFALGGLSLGLLLSLGGVAVGSIAFGGIAVGLFAVGGLAVGIYSIGGCAVALKIAAGGYASGHIAIGDTANGYYTFITNTPYTSEMIREMILNVAPDTWNFLIEIFSNSRP